VYPARESQTILDFLGGIQHDVDEGIPVALRGIAESGDIPMPDRGGNLLAGASAADG
jgi:hypothetical protein